MSFLGPCCPAALYCIAVHDCLMLTERINDDDDDVTTALRLSIVDLDASPSRLRSFFAITQSIKISPGASESIEISFLPFSPGSHQCALILSDDSVGELLYLINGNALLPLPEEIPMLNNAPGNICCIL